MSAVPDVTRTDILVGLRGLGVQTGDALLVHSSLSRFGHVVGGADAVIDALRDAVGPTGTLVMPSHTWKTISNVNPVFDVRRTPSCVGTIAETFRLRPAVLRSLHPTHSCAALGPMAEELLRGHETHVTPCGRRSPYQRLMDCGGKIVFLGCTLAVNTSFHAVEEIANVPYLFRKFEMLYVVDYDGVRRPVPSRRHAGGPRDYERMEPVFLERGAMVKGRIGRADVRIVDAGLMETVVTRLMADNPFILLRETDWERFRAWFYVNGKDRW